jgi:hypothetical protein
MAKPNDFENEVRKASQIAEDALRNISANVKDIFEEALNQTNTFSKNITSDINKGLKSLSNTSVLFESNLSKLSIGQLKYADVQKQIEQRNIKIKSLELQRNIAMKNLVNSNGDLVDGMKEVVDELAKTIEYNKLVEKSLEDQAKAAQKIEQKLGNTGKLLKGISKIPILGNLIDAEEALSAAQANAAKDGATQASTLQTAFKSLKGSMRESITDPLTVLTLTVTVFKQMIKYAFEFNDLQINTARQLGMSSKAAYDLTENMREIAINSGNAYANIKNFSEINTEINAAMGTNVTLTSKQLEDQLELKEAVGLEAAEREIILGLSLRNNKTQEQIFNNIGKQNKGVLNSKQVLSEVLKISGQLRAQYKDDEVLLSKAVIQAQRLGISLEQTKNISGKLLNFEESISAELEAELLTGMDLRMEKARYLALQGDSAGAAKELMNNLGPNGLVKFQKMNVIQQEALARSLGMGVDELANTLVKQKQLNTLTIQDQNELKKKKQELIEQGKIEEANALEREAIAGKSFKLAEQERKEKEKLTASIDNLKRNLFGLLSGPISSIIKSITSAIEFLNGSPILKKMLGVVGIGVALTGIISSIKILSSVFSKGAVPVTVVGGGLGDTSGPGVGDIGKTLGGGKSASMGKQLSTLIKNPKAYTRALKRGGLNLTKRIPYIGAAAGLASEIAEGGLNWESIARAGLSGGGAFLGGSLGTIGGLGAASIPLGIAGGVGGGMAGDWLGDQIFGERKEMATGGIVNKPTRALVGEAGPEAVIPLDKFYAKMDELISVIKTGGNVYLDSTKVGTAMSVGTYRTQ